MKIQAIKATYFDSSLFNFKQKEKKEDKKKKKSDFQQILEAELEKLRSW